MIGTGLNQAEWNRNGVEASWKNAGISFQVLSTS